MARSPHDLSRRSFLKSAGIASAVAGAWSGGFLQGCASEPQESMPAGAKETLDELLQRNRNRVLAADGRIGGTLAHVPLALMAQYRIGASPAQMRSFFGDDPCPSQAPRSGGEEAEPLTEDNWRGHLRTGVSFSRWFAFFESWLEQASVQAVLTETLPTLIRSGVSAFDHTLIHASYAIDYGGRGEIAYALASWASTCRPEQQFDLAPAAVEPDVLLAQIVDATSDLKLVPRGGNSGPIVWRLDQVLRYEPYSKQLKPVRIPASDPLSKFSEIILELFCETHEFTLLHALTTCQALRNLLPYVSDRERTLGAYWHSVCASYITVRRMPQFDAAKEAEPTGGADWEEIVSRAAASDDTIQESQYVHRVKLTYSCLREFEHYQRDLYRAVSAREVERASQIILG